jgi:hypothetical protein
MNNISAVAWRGGLAHAPVVTFTLAVVALAIGLGLFGSAQADELAPPGHPGVPYANQPDLAPIGVRVDCYLPVPEEAIVPEIAPAKGYRLEELGRGLFMVTDNAYQSMFLVYEDGVVVIDAPPNYSKHLLAAIGEVTDKAVTHVVYSHSHIDHIGGPGSGRQPCPDRP